MKPTQQRWQKTKSLLFELRRGILQTVCKYILVTGDCMACGLDSKMIGGRKKIGVHTAENPADETKTLHGAGDSNSKGRELKKMHYLIYNLALMTDFLYPKTFFIYTSTHVC